MTPKAQPVLTDRTYCNPLPIDHADTGLDQLEAYSNADPYVLKYCGEYYCYSTGIDGVHVLHSRDLTRFGHLGYALQADGERNYWAPCVYYDNGLFYMYYSSNPEGEEDDHCHMLKLAVADRPQGPFRFQKQFTQVFAIDPHLVQDGDGQRYLFYSVNTLTGADASCAGTSIVVDRILDFGQLEGDPKPVIPPSLDEEIFQRNRFGDGRDWYTVEGAFYLEKHGRAYVMYSGNAFLSPHYFVGYSHADKTGPIGSLKWEKETRRGQGFPLIGMSEQVMGTGHNSVVRAPNNVDDWIVYHGRDTKIEEDDLWYEVRIMRMDPLLWGNGRPLTPAPTHTEQDAPALPAFRADFARGLEGLEALGGRWETVGGSAVQTRHDAFASLLAEAVELTNHHTEAWLKWEPHHMGGRYGVYAAWQDRENCVLAELHVGRRAVRLYGVQNGVAGPAVEKKVPRDFRFECWHKLAVRRTGGHFAVLVDDLPCVSAQIDAKTGSVGVFGAYTALRCSALEVTDYLELNENNGQGVLSQIRASAVCPDAAWSIQGDCLYARANAGTALFQRAPSNLRLSVNLRVPAGTKGEGAGVYADYVDESNYLLALLCPDGQGLTVRRVEAGKETVCIRGECSGDSVALLTKKHGKRLCLMADGLTIYEGDAFRDGGCGFYASRAACFHGVELLGL